MKSDIREFLAICRDIVDSFEPAHTAWEVNSSRGGSDLIALYDRFKAFLEKIEKEQ